MKKTLSLILALMMALSLFSGLSFTASAAEAELAAEGEDYTDPEHPYIATDYAGLREVFNKYSLSGKKKYIKLGADIYHEVNNEEFELKSNGADIDFDLAGYSLYVYDISTSKVNGYFIRGANGTVILSDSKRYDAAKGEWIEGYVKYKYALYDDHFEATSVLCAHITVKSGKYINATEGSYTLARSTVYYGYGLAMYGGTFEGPLPAYLTTGAYKSVVYDGTFNTTDMGEYGICAQIHYLDDPERLSIDPVVLNCKINNGVSLYSSSESAVCVEYVDKSYVTTDEQKCECFAKLFPYMKEVYRDGKRQTKLAEGSPNHSGGLSTYLEGRVFGPTYKNTYEVRSKTFIEELNVTIGEPYPGANPSYNASVPSGVNYQIENKMAGSWRNGVLWKKGVNGTSVSPTDTFVDGNKYSPYISIIPLNTDDYVFAPADEIVATVNGQPAKIYKYSDTNYGVFYTFTASKTTIDTVSITLPVSEAGAAASYLASTPEGAGYELVTNYLADNWWNGVHYQTFSGVEKAPGFTLEAGERYWVSFVLRLTDSNRYAFSSSAAVTVNGNAAILYFANGYYHVDSVLEIENPIDEIDQIEVTIPSIRVGDQMTWSASAPDGADYEVDNSSSGFKANGVIWYIDNAAVTPGKVRYFEEGVTYKVAISVNAKDANACHFAAEEKLSASVNGKAAAVSRTSDAKIWVNYTFTATDQSDLTTISEVAVTLPEPAAYAERSYDAAVPSGAGYQIADLSEGVWKNGVSWAVNGTAVDADDSGVLQPGDTFYISVVLDITDAQAYEFADDDYILAFVNGKVMTASVFSDKQRCVVFYTGTIPSEKTVINTIAVTIPEPVAGGAPSFTAGVASGQGYRIEDYDEDYWLNGVTWYDETAKKTLPLSGATFVAGGQYSVTISVEITDTSEYEFADMDDMTVTVNGKPAQLNVYSAFNFGVMATFDVSEGGGFVLGDVDGSGKTDIVDATIVQRYATGLKLNIPEEQIETRGDVNASGKTDITDATFIQRYATNIPTPYDIGKTV